MAFGRKDDMGEPMSSGSSNSGGAAAGGFGNLTAFIDQGSEFEGKLSFKDTVRIDGRFTGEISSENTLIVGETGEIQANIHSPAVVISGTVVGDVFASRQLVMHKTARLTGDIDTPNLVMEEGATVNGNVKMQAAAPKGAAGSDAKPQPAPNAKPQAQGSNGSK